MLLMKYHQMKGKQKKNYIRVKKKSPQPANEKFTVFRKLTTKMSNRSWWSVKKKIFVKIENPQMLVNVSA